jgi:hypothetical protein
MKNLLVIAIVVVSITLGFGVRNDASAQSLCIPEECSGQGEYVPDFSCINRKLLDPTDTCCENKCKDSAGAEEPEVYREVINSFFGYSLAVRDGQQIPVLINLAITTVLGFVSLYALVMGIYLGGYVRSRATTAEEIESTNKKLTTLIIGFILAWGFIVIVQIVANLIGLGSLNSLELVGSGGSDIVIQ